MFIFRIINFTKLNFAEKCLLTRIQTQQTTQKFLMNAFC